MKAKIYVKHAMNGSMTKSEEGPFPSSNQIKIDLTISPDIRIMDLEKVFKEIQNKFMYWTRDVDSDSLYIIDE